MSGYPSQTRSFRSGGSIRSHSTSELLLEAKDQASSFREGLLRTTRQAAQMTNLGLLIFCNIIITPAIKHLNLSLYGMVFPARALRSGAKKSL